MYKLLILVFFVFPMNKNQQISFSVQDPILKEIITNIESQTQYKFAFRDDVDLERRVAGKFNFKNIKLEEVLEEISRRTPYTLKIVGNNIAIGFDKTTTPQIPKPKDIQSEVRGTVTDPMGMPLAGVNILEKGTTNGVQTDFDGNYAINVSEGAILAFSYIGMKSVEHTVGSQNILDVSMLEDSALLDEVVVTALGISREKKSLGYATTVLEAKGVNRAPSENIANQLSGKVAGLQIRQNNNM